VEYTALLWVFVCFITGSVGTFGSRSMSSQFESNSWFSFNETWGGLLQLMWARSPSKFTLFLGFEAWSKIFDKPSWSVMWFVVFVLLSRVKVFVIGDFLVHGLG